MSKKDVYYNCTDKPIFIVARYEVDSLGGPAVSITQFCIHPGDGIDLAIIGMKRAKVEISNKASKIKRISK